MPPKKLSKEQLELEEKEFERRLNEWKGFVRIPTDKILNQVKQKVCAEKLFKPEEYARLCKLQKRRIKNISNNLTVMLFLGMPLPSEDALRSKVGLPPRINLKVKEEASDDDGDADWKPNKPKPKPPGMTSVAEYSRRKKFITAKCLVDNEKHKPDALKGIDLEKFIEIWPETLPRVQKPMKEDCDDNAERRCHKEIPEAPRYPSRESAKKTYTEPHVPQDDDFLYCDSCDKLNEGECLIHGPYIKVSDTRIKWGLVKRARRSCPDGISIGPSKIRSGGNGAWADKDFPKMSVFGPYEGVNVHKDDLKKLKMLFEGGYAWEIYKKGKLSHYIDGGNEKMSNWLRYINCARNEEEQNLIAYQYQGKIYYRAYKYIKKGMELLVWYGDQYAEQLGVSTKKVVKEAVALRNSKLHDPFFGCKKCGKIFSSEEYLEKHMKYKHPDRSFVKRHKCEFCLYSSDNKHHLADHIRTHTKEKPFKCHVCGKGFTESRSLKTHIRIHTKEKPYKCEKCGEQFNRCSSLERHIRTVHDKLKPYICNVCASAFGELRVLSSHLLTHTGVRQFKCQYCDKRFALVGNLRTHERIHTGVKPYKCKECKADFNQSSNLHRHVITQHTKRYPYRCSICDKGFLTPGKLKKHNDNVHENV